jgi:hypothetical protein
MEISSVHFIHLLYLSSRATQNPTAQNRVIPQSKIILLILHITNLEYIYKGKRNELYFCRHQKQGLITTKTSRNERMNVLCCYKTEVLMSQKHGL